MFSAQDAKNTSGFFASEKEKQTEQYKYIKYIMPIEESIHSATRLGKYSCKYIKFSNNEVNEFVVKTLEDYGYYVCKFECFDDIYEVRWDK